MTGEPPPKRTRTLALALRIGFALLLLVTALAIGFAVGVVIQSKPQWALLSTAPSDAEFERRVADYLAKNPEAIADAFEAYAARQGGSAKISQEPRAGATPRDVRPMSAAERSRALLEDATSPVRGAAKGDVTLVEFFDYNCPYCRQAVPILADLMAANPGLRVIYKEFPILSDNSRFAARAALAAHRQNKYFEFHDALMAAGGIVEPEKVIEVARRVGISIGRLRLDMTDPKIQAAIDRNIELGHALRITGTPGFVVGDHVFRGAADIQTLQALIDRAARAR